MNVSELKSQFLALTLKDGEQYAGILLGQDGEPDQHVILLPGEVSKSWDQAKAWAEKIGGALPTRREQRLLMANLKPEFKPAAYWSGETYSSNDGWAWYLHFGYGYQGYNHKSAALRARAVRRLVIE